MPIRPENKDRYPIYWSTLRRIVLARANNCCEFCGVPNYLFGYRDDFGVFHPVYCPDWWGRERPVVDGRTLMRIVLTIAHLNHKPEDCRLVNLRALCQRCHLLYDAEHHKQSRYANARKGRALGDFFDAA